MISLCRGRRDGAYGRRVGSCSKCGSRTSTSARVVPLWPQLEEILRPYVFGQDRPPTRLLFPARSATGECTTGECMVTNFDGSLDQLAARACWQAGEIRTKMFRHTYCAARLQTLDHGAPVSVYSVGRELGHGGDALVRRVYGHLGVVRHREYRVEHFVTELGDRLTTLAELAPLLAPPRSMGRGR